MAELRFRVFILLLTFLLFTPVIKRFTTATRCRLFLFMIGRDIGRFGVSCRPFDGMQCAARCHCRGVVRSRCRHCRHLCHHRHHRHLRHLRHLAAARRRSRSRSRRRWAPSSVPGWLLLVLRAFLVYCERGTVCFCTRCRWNGNLMFYIESPSGSLNGGFFIISFL